MLCYFFWSLTDKKQCVSKTQFISTTCK